MMYIVDFFLYLAHNISVVGDYISIISNGIGQCFTLLFDMIASFPLWLVIPMYSMLVLAIVFQVISFIPTESGGH